YHTTDGGRHWQIQSTPTIQHLYSVAFINPKTGWVVGRSGEILHTTDGGQNWLEQQSGTTKHLFKVAFLGVKNGWAVGDWGVVLYTDDGGKAWRDQSLAEDQILYSVDFADANHGWMVGEFGSILHTSDGGIKWEKQPTPTLKTFFGVTAVSPEKAWAVGIDGLVVRTQNAGATWEIQQGQAEVATFEAIGFVELLKNPGLYDIKIRDKYGYIVGDVGNVLVTEDGGETWTGVLLPSEWRLNWIRGLNVLPSGQGMLVGAAGLTFIAKGKEMRFSQVLE
ncbi:MAG: WD40/YVTN/BNR-like repeat-containing protein, partial [bacterium]